MKLFGMVSVVALQALPLFPQEVTFSGASPSRIEWTVAVPIICNSTATGTFTSTDNVWYGVDANGRAFVGPVRTYDFNGTANTAVALTYTSTDTQDDLILGIYFPPDGSTSVFKRAGSVSLLLPLSGLYKIGAGGTVGGNYALRIDCSSGGTPNLTPVRGNGWSDKILVQTSASLAGGSTLDSTALLPTDSLYLSWAVGNIGTGATTAAFYVDIYVDGRAFSTQFYRHDASPILPNWYVAWTGANLGLLSAGPHTIRVVVDSTNAIQESNKTDNEYIKTITVQGSVPTPTPTPPLTLVPRIPIIRAAPVRRPR